MLNKTPIKVRDIRIHYECNEISISYIRKTYYHIFRVYIFMSNKIVSMHFEKGVKGTDLMFSKGTLILRHIIGELYLQEK